MLARAWWLVCVPIAVMVVTLLHGGYDHVLAVFEDDASYYLLIAENIVKTGRSTFDGTAVTTGYHPLWLVLNIGLAWLSGGDRETWLLGLVLVCAALSLTQAALLQRLLARLAPASPALVSSVVLLVSAWSLRLSFSGMECALATPALIWCALALYEELEAGTPSARGTLRLGLLAALCGLARVDSLLFGLASGAVALLARKPFSLPRTLRLGAWFALGLLPFVIYLGINYAIAGSLLTTSAQAKSLASGLAWNVHVFANVNRTGQAALAISLLGGLLVASPWTPWRGAARAVALTSFGFPLFFYASLAVRSSWSIWNWYLYPVPLAVSLAAVALGERVRLGRLVPRLSPPAWLGQAGVVAAFLVASLMGLKLARERGNNEVGRDTARAIAKFAVSHEGNYAMGDRAGLTAFLAPRPFLQLEGLVADRELLEAIRRERPLREVLEQRGVDYLVETVPKEQVVGRCLEVAEPKAGQAGHLSPKMRGVFCDPVTVIPDGFGWVTTLIYSVKQPTAGR